MSNLDALREALGFASPQPPWDTILEVVDHADDTGVDLQGANALLALQAVNALPALLDRIEKLEAIAEAASSAEETLSDWLRGREVSREYLYALRDGLSVALARLEGGDQ